MRAGLKTYWLLTAGFGLLALLISWTPLAVQIDSYSTDWLFRLHRPTPWPTETAILGIDDDSFRATRGNRDLRSSLARALTILKPAQPKIIAIDVTLDDAGDPGEDTRLTEAIRQAGNVILPCELLDAPRRWEDPQPAFRKAAAGLGHVHANPDIRDGMSRQLPLEEVAGRDRRWALALEAFRLARQQPIVETDDALLIGTLHVPTPKENRRLLRIRYLPPDDQDHSRIPQITLLELLQHPERAEAFRGKVVFVGATAQSAVRDRMTTPYSTSRPMPGVEIHAHAYETLAQGRFLTDASPSLVLALSLLAIAGAGLIFQQWSGAIGYGLGAVLIVVSHALPHIFFLNGIIYPYFAPVLTAWIAAACAAIFQYFRTRRVLAHTESERSRYQQAIQFVTHEMRTPLSAIQGSSELMNRYKLSEEKQKQLSLQIQSESKRLARMVQTFLDVEKLSAGQMELKKEPFDMETLVKTCVDRVRPLAERKSIAITLHPPAEATVQGDSELMEYAVYNLLTNAVKYSPAETIVDVQTRMKGGGVQVAVADQGIGMNAEELKKIGQKFYRTRTAEQSGEVGTGIGLSIVQQIVEHHRGRLTVTSSPGHGSCFTIEVPATVPPVSVPPGSEK